MGVSEPEYFCLSLLSMSGPIPKKEIIGRLEHTGHHPDSEIFARLARKKYIDTNNNNICISKKGRQIFIKILAQSKALEEQLLKHFSNDELLEANNFLKKIIKITGSDKQQVGAVASKLKTLRKIEPYKGKGVREKGQHVLKKEGKKK